MLSARDTAYPIRSANPTAQELDELFIPTMREVTFAAAYTRQPAPRLGRLLLLKRPLGNFVQVRNIPAPIVRQPGGIRKRREARVARHGAAEHQCARLGGLPDKRQDRVRGARPLEEGGLVLPGDSLRNEAGSGEAESWQGSPTPTGVVVRCPVWAEAITASLFPGLR